jgi:hypothetical protein
MPRLLGYAEKGNERTVQYKRSTFRRAKNKPFSRLKQDEILKNLNFLFSLNLCLIRAGIMITLPRK